jgi:hypothetical protein
MSDLKYRAGRRRVAHWLVLGANLGAKMRNREKKGIKNVVLGSFREKLLCYN